MAVKAGVRPVVADAADGLAGDFGDIHIAVGGDLAHDQHHAGGCGALAGDARIGVLGEDCVQYAVGDLVTDLVGMSFGYGLGGEDSFLHIYSFLSP